MNLTEYIKFSFPRFNKVILENLGATEKLIKYLMTTSYNTNFKIVEGLLEKEKVITELDIAPATDDCSIMKIIPRGQTAFVNLNGQWWTYAFPAKIYRDVDTTIFENVEGKRFYLDTGEEGRLENGILYFLKTDTQIANPFTNKMINPEIQIREYNGKLMYSTNAIEEAGEVSLTTYLNTMATSLATTNGKFSKNKFFMEI